MRPLIALLPVLLAAQEPGFVVQTRLVFVPTTVQNAQGRPVDGLTEANFKILDNGVPQPFSMDTSGTGVARVALMVAVQTSGISASALVKVRHIGAMIQPLVTGEQAAPA